MPPHKPSNLKRRRATREPKARFFIFCEGKNTEPAYLAAIKQSHRDALIDIKLFPEAGVPYTQAELAIEMAKDLGIFGRKRDSFERDDQVWVVFDRDDHPRYDEAVGLCAIKNIKVARSNPCFELWLILHYRDYDKADGRHAVQAFLQTLDPAYQASGQKLDSCKSVIVNLEAAEHRAEAQLNRRDAEGTPYGPPSTTMFLLTRAIHEASQRAR
jgi:hypothetical protein